MMRFESLLRELDADASRETGAEFTSLVADYLARTRRGEGPVTTAHTAEELVARFAEPLPLQGKPLSEVLARLREQVLPDVTCLTHPMYMGHQVSAPLPVAIWTEALISALNQSTAVREMAPTVNAIEHQLIRWMADVAGLGPAAGGTLTSGGTEATFTALLAARAAALPNAWEEGMVGPLPVVVCGEHAHYSVTRAVAALGLGTRRVVTVPALDHRMGGTALRFVLDRLHADGTKVMAVVATAGSTPTGSFDELTEIGPLCTERGLWLHVDGAHGAAALLSAQHRARLHGIEHAHSVSWDPHKMMLLPLPAGMLLVRDQRQLEAAFAQQAPYLFHGTVDGRSWDLGRRSFQCSRRADALKVWVAIQRYGADGLGVLYDGLCASAQKLHALLTSQRDFEVLHRPESNILCFRHVPRALAPLALDGFNEKLRERYHRAGRGYITLTTLDGKRVLRVSVMNPLTQTVHLEQLLVGLREEGDALLHEAA